MTEATEPQPGCVLGLDFGLRRIGVAITDGLGVMAHPLTTITNTGLEPVLQELKALIDDREVGRLVVGIPYNMDGSRGKSAKQARRFARDLEKGLELPVDTVDERLTTCEAEERLRGRRC